MVHPKDIANSLIQQLKRYDFIIHRYNSFSSKSIYLKLDYGLAFSIRISDHPSKKAYKYRYNVITKFKRPGNYLEIDEGKDRYFFTGTKDQIRLLVKQIVEQRDLNVQFYGEQGYMKAVNRNRIQSEGEKGFWGSAWLV